MAAAITHQLPEDVVVDILARFPVKSVKRFKCVSKSWCALIQSPEFISFHYSYSKNKPCPLIGHEHDVNDRMMVSLLSNQTLDVELANLDIPPFATDSKILIDIRGFCNGILCLYHIYVEDILLWNFATKEFKILPMCPVDYKLDYNYNYNIEVVGFGYDSKRDDYKVVRIATLRDVNMYNIDSPRIYQLALYSLTTDSWRKLDGDLTANIFHSGLCFGGCNRSGFYLNGFYHSCAAIDGQRVILSFDMSNEVFITTPFPDGSFGNNYKEALFRDNFYMEINGSVGGLFCVNGYGADKCYDVWVLGELGLKNSWSKLFTIGPFYYILLPLGAGSNGEFFFAEASDFLVCHHPSNQETKTLQFPGFTTKVVMYAESLVSLRGGTAFIH